MLLTKLENVLGKAKPTNRGNYSFKCPICKHYKNKLEINLITQQYHCWIGCVKGNRISSLLKSANIHPSLIQEINQLTPKPGKIPPKSYEQISLPKEYKPLYNIPKNDITAKHVLNYLKSRGVTKNDILRYNIGYCDKGEYKNFIIIPSFDSTFKLNYFIARTYAKGSFIHYKNPEITKDVIGLESLVNFRAPITICEGIFDAISIKRNVIPLFGKEISNELKKKLSLTSVGKIYIALDKDAMKQAIKHAKDLLDAGKEVYLIELDEKDPSLMGFEKFTNLIHTVKPLTLSSFMEFKLKYAA